jgi:hypothetical protein
MAESRMLLVTVAPAWLVKKIEDAWGDQLRKAGKLATIDVDSGDTQEVELSDDEVKIVITVTPKKTRPRA